MAAITTAQLRSIANSVIVHYHGYTFLASSTARWAPHEKTVYYTDITSPADLETLLHELGHAVLGHQDFQQDVQLVRMEREAWTKAAEIAKQFGYHIDSDLAEDALDSYRQWLHARSRCPRCNATGVQNRQSLFICPICRTKWRANDARQCGLKRQQQK